MSADFFMKYTEVRNPKRFAIMQHCSDLPEQCDDELVKKVAEELSQGATKRSFQFLAAVLSALLEEKRDLTIRDDRCLLAVRLFEAIVTRAASSEA